MALLRKTRRGARSAVLSASAAVLAANSADAAESSAGAASFAKRPGEVKVVAMITHDAYHNGVMQEVQLRGIFAEKKDWRFIACRSASHFTPGLIADADLLILAAASVREHLDLTAGPVSDTASPGGILWTEANVAAVVSNVRDRGMGLMSLHASFYARNRTIFGLLGAEPIMHHEVQPLWVHGLDKEHPITKDIGRFMIGLDEQFSAVILSQYTTSLFTTTAIHDKRDAAGGWCLENGKGRVVCLLPGHTSSAYAVPEYREIVWRAAHWAVNRPIPKYTG